ncbi:uncharacterized protein LOC142532007 isoform X1 [Primulina tabacum]|uniref:uncharacterized protein LOC142532007 isoform X1 n=1 Tax=Primulina tabacum TaxID=48773 RepID=UPI003F592AEA
MGDSACVMRGCSYDSAIHNESKQGNGHMEVLGDSVSFGRFMNEPLSWEKWSTFSHKKYVEEAESYSKPGSVAQKKAFFEAHYKRKAAQKAAAEQGSAANESNGTVVEGQDYANKINGSQRISLKLEPLLVVDEKMNMVKIPDHEINDGVENGKATSLLSVAEDAKDQKQAEIIWTKYSLETPKKKNQRKKKFFSKYLCNLYGLFPTEEPDNEPHSATVKTGITGITPGSLATEQEGEAPLKTPVVGTIDGVSKNPASTPPKNRRKKTPTSPSAPRSKTTHRKWLIFSSVPKSSRNHRSQTSSK